MIYVIIRLNGFYVSNYFIVTGFVIVYCLCDIIEPISICISVLFFSYDSISTLAV